MTNEQAESMIRLLDDIRRETSLARLESAETATEIVQIRKSIGWLWIYATIAFAFPALALLDSIG